MTRLAKETAAQFGDSCGYWRCFQQPVPLAVTDSTPIHRLKISRGAVRERPAVWDKAWSSEKDRSFKYGHFLSMAMIVVYGTSDNNYHALNWHSGSSKFFGNDCHVDSAPRDIDADSATACANMETDTVAWTIDGPFSVIQTRVTVALRVPSLIASVITEEGRTQIKELKHLLSSVLVLLVWADVCFI